jgi:hypothetical protein
MINNTNKPEELLYLKVLEMIDHTSPVGHQDKKGVQHILFRESIDCFPVNPWREGWMPIFYV